MNKFGTEKLRRLEDFLDGDTLMQWVWDEDLDIEKAVGEFFYRNYKNK